MRNYVLFTIAMLAVINWSCAPVFSDIQSARLAGKGNFEATPHFTTASFTSDSETDHVQNHFGLQVAYGISDRFDVRPGMKTSR